MRNSDFDQLERTFGIVMPEVVDYTTNLLAMDAQPPLVTTSNAGIPAWLANYIDPDFVQIPGDAQQGRADSRRGEERRLDHDDRDLPGDRKHRRGDQLRRLQRERFRERERRLPATAVVPLPDDDAVGRTATGDEFAREDRLRRAREGIASAIVLDKFQNNTYFYGVAGLQNYGLLNDPRLSPSLAPGPKAFNNGASGPWITNGAVTATANEIYTDIQTLFNELVLQSGGLIEMDTKMTLAMAPSSSVALTTTNTYNVNVTDMLKKNFPAMRVETAVQYQNPTGGNLVQLIADAVEGQKTGYCAFTEKLRAHGIVRETSSFKQKKSQGSWGAVIFQPFAIASMLGA